MLKNNVKTLIYHGLWYFVVASVFFVEKSRTIIERFVADETMRLLIMGVATLLFSLIFTVLFMKPQGSFGKNLSSNTTLLILNIGVIGFVAVMYLFERLSLYQTIMTVLFILVQLITIMTVMHMKDQKEEEFDE